MAVVVGTLATTRDTVVMVDMGVTAGMMAITTIMVDMVEVVMGVAMTTVAGVVMVDMEIMVWDMVGIAFSTG